MPIGAAANELLSSLLKHKDRKTLASLQESQFVSDDERKAFRRFRSHVNRYGTFPTRITLTRKYKVPYTKTSEPVGFYLDNFINRAKFNAMRDSAGSFMDALGVRDVETAERIVEEMSMKCRAMRTELGGAVRSFQDIAQQVMDEYRTARFQGGMLGITSGWPEIAAVTGGYLNGDVISYVARLGRGKTMLLLYQALKAAQSGKRVLFVSPEVPDVQLVRRMIGMITGFDPKLIARGQLSTDLYRTMVETITGIGGNLPITFAAGNYKKSMPFVKSMCEELEPDIVFIDAMYLLTPEKKRNGSGGRREVISDVAEEIKDLATSRDIPVVISAQFNRSAAVKDKDEQTGEQSRTRRDPLKHLDVHKIGETDVIAQISSLVFVSELGDPPRSTTTRYIGLKKGREGEAGFWLINYLFRPFNMSVISHDNQNQTPEEISDEELDIDLAA